MLSDVLRHIIELATQRYVDDQAGPDNTSSASAAAGTRTHAKVVDLIAAKDAVGAEALWRKHILATSVRLRNAGIAETVIDLLQ